MTTTTDADGGRTAEPYRSSNPSSPSEPSLHDKAAAAAGQARQVGSEAKEQAQEVMHEAKAQAREMVHRTRSELDRQGEAQTEKAASGLRTLARQVDALASGDREAAGPMADYAEQARRRIEDFAGRLEQDGYRGLLDDIARFARRRPGLFLLGAAGAGLVAGRIVKSLGSSDDDGYDSRARPGDHRALGAPGGPTPAGNRREQSPAEDDRWAGDLVGSNPAATRANGGMLP